MTPARSAAKALLDRTRDAGEAEGLLIEEELQRSVIGKPNQLDLVIVKNAFEFLDLAGAEQHARLCFRKTDGI